MSIKEKFCRKVADEYQTFRNQMLGRKKREIYGNAYRIDIYISVYEILMEYARGLGDGPLAFLLSEQELMKGIYDSWMKKEDSFYTELSMHVYEELQRIMEKYKTGGNDGRSKNKTFKSN